MNENRIPAPALTEDELEQLDLFLERHADQGGLDVSMLHGFLTAIALAPVKLQPQHWLPEIHGEGQPRFNSQAESEQITQLILRLYNEVNSTLNGPEVEENFAPILYFSEEDEPDCSGWSMGFSIGMHVFAEDVWGPYFEQEDTASLLSLILALATPETTEELQKTLPEDVDVQEAVAGELPVFLSELKTRIAAIEAAR